VEIYEGWLPETLSEPHAWLSEQLSEDLEDVGEEESRIG